MNQVAKSILEKRTSKSKLKYNKQRKAKKRCVSSLRRAKRNYHKNLDLNDINDIKYSGLQWNPSFTSKYNPWKTDENGKLVKDEKEVANIFNDFFVNTVPSVGINTKYDFLNTINNSHNSKCYLQMWKSS